MKKLIPVILVICMVLCGCNEGDVQPSATTTVPAVTTGPSTQPSTEPVTQPTTEPPTVPPTVPPTEPATEPPTEPVLNYRHPITGELLAEPMTNRPVAIVINNIQNAQPLHSISHADVLFEIVAEGTVTRFLGIYTDLAGVENIGSIRSSRTYLIDLARSFNAPLIHCGGSIFALEELQTSGWPHLDEMYNNKYFYRNQDRLNKGYPREHTLFAHGDNLLAGLSGYNMTVGEDAYYGFDHAEGEVQLNGAPATNIQMTFFKGGKSTHMVYDAESGMYHGTQYWKNLTAEIADANYDLVLDFKNVFILNAVTSTNGYRMFAELSGEGTGYYACNGQIVPIKWSRDGYAAPFTYTLEDGTPLTVAVGKTYIGVIPSGSPVEFS